MFKEIGSFLLVDLAVPAMDAAVEHINYLCIVSAMQTSGPVAVLWLSLGTARLVMQSAPVRTAQIFTCLM